MSGYPNQPQNWQDFQPPGQHPPPPGLYPSLNQQYGQPGQQYTAPGQQYTPPGQQYTAPGQQYTPPGQQYTAPGQQYTPPGQQYGQLGQQYPPQAGLSYPGGQQPIVTHTAPYYPGQPTVTPHSAQTQVQWIPTTPQQAIGLSDRAVVAGYEGHDGSPLWVIRARHERDLIPGKLAIKHQTAYVPWGGKENSVREIEVCCALPERIKWIESRDGNIPPKAIEAGNTSSGEPLYVGRAKEQGSLTPGKVQSSHKGMYISFGGKEIAHKIYEIMCYA